MRAVIAFVMLLAAGPALAGSCDRWVFKGYDEASARQTAATHTLFASYEKIGAGSRAVEVLGAIHAQARRNPSAAAVGLCTMGVEPVEFLRMARMVTEARQGSRPAPEPVRPRPMTCHWVAGILNCI